MWLDVWTHISVFESLQLEGSHEGNKIATVTEFQHNQFYLPRLNFFFSAFKIKSTQDSWTANSRTLFIYPVYQNSPPPSPFLHSTKVILAAWIHRDPLSLQRILTNYPFVRNITSLCTYLLNRSYFAFTILLKFYRFQLKCAFFQEVFPDAQPQSQQCQYPAVCIIKILITIN